MQKCIGCNKRKQLNKHKRCSDCQTMADQARGRRAAEISVAAAAAPADDGRGRGGSKPPPINRQGQRRGSPR